MFALIHQMSQYISHAHQVSDLVVDLNQSCIGDTADRGSISTVLQSQQFADFRERQPQFLPALDETNPTHQADGIASIRPSCRWHRQQTALLVVPDRLDPYIGGTCQTTYGERCRIYSVRTCFHKKLDSGVEYRV